MKFKKKFYALLFLLAAQNSFAASNFTITPYGTVPTTIVSGQTVSAYYTLTNMTSTTRNGYSIQGLPQGVTQNTASPNCSNPINLAPYASCHLQFDIAVPVSTNFAICKGASCTTATAPISVTAVSTPPMPKFLYVANASNTLGPATVCSLNQATGAIVSCVGTGGGSIVPDPEGLIVNNVGTMAYLTGEDTSVTDVYQCPINVDGTFNTCSAVTISSPASFFTYYGTSALNPANTVAYFTGYNSANAGAAQVIACPIVNNNVGSNCVDTGAPVNNYQIGITLNSAGTTAFITNAYGTGVVTICNVSSNGTAFSGCMNKTGAGSVAFSNDLGSVAVNNVNWLVYVSDNGNSAVYACSATFNNCFLAGSITSAGGIVINKAGTIAYVSEEYGDLTYTCPILANGTFSTCTSTPGFVSGYSASLRY